MSYPDDPGNFGPSSGGASDGPYGAGPDWQYTGQTQPGQPYGTPSNPAPQYPAYPAVPYAQTYPAARGTNGMAIGALIASLVGIVTCGIGSIVGAILGHVALGQIKKTGEEGHGMALAGVIVGWVFVGLWAIYWIFVVSLGIYGINHPRY